MGESAVLKLADKDDVLCTVLREEFPRVVLSADGPVIEVVQGSRAVLIEHKMGQRIARSGHIASVAESMVAFEVEPSLDGPGSKGPRLTDCHLPAMLRPRSADGNYGGWRGALITRHSPNCLHIQVEEGLVVPSEAELLFSPIGSEVSGPRTYGEDGGMMNAADVRSRRIRARAVTRDVLPGECGTVTLVVDISRTLYRAA